MDSKSTSTARVMLVAIGEDESLRKSMPRNFPLNPFSNITLGGMLCHESPSPESNSGSAEAIKENGTAAAR